MEIHEEWQKIPYYQIRMNLAVAIDMQEKLDKYLWDLKIIFQKSHTLNNIFDII